MRKEVEEIKESLISKLIVENVLLRGKIEESNTPLNEKQIDGQISIEEYKKTLRKGKDDRRNNKSRNS